MKSREDADAQGYPIANGGAVPPDVLCTSGLHSIASAVLLAILASNLFFTIIISDMVTPFVTYRYELIGSSFIPEGLGEDPRHTVAIGSAILLLRPQAGRWTPKLGMSVGWFNSLTGGEGDSGMIFGVGLIVDSPLRARRLSMHRSVRMDPAGMVMSGTARMSTRPSF